MLFQGEWRNSNRNTRDRSLYTIPSWPVAESPPTYHRGDWRSTSMAFSATIRSWKRGQKRGTQIFLDDIESIDVGLRDASTSTHRAR